MYLHLSRTLAGYAHSEDGRETLATLPTDNGGTVATSQFDRNDGWKERNVNDIENAIDSDQIAQFERDGVMCFRNLLSASWVDRLRAGVERALRNPSPFYTGKNDPQNGVFATDYGMWRTDPDFRDFVFESPLGRYAAAFMRSRQAFLLVDLMLVKGPHSTYPTPWHTDKFYGWYEGRQLCSFWVGLDETTRESGAVEFVRGSHLTDRDYMPVNFMKGSGKFDEALDGSGVPKSALLGLLPVPDVESRRSEFDIVHFHTHPGDVVMNSLRVLHAASGNATDRWRRAIAFRFAGDDVVYAPKSFSASPIGDPGLQPGDPIGCELFPQVWPPRA